VETVQWWVDLIHKDKVSPVPAEYAQLEGGDISYMASSKVGMITAGGWGCDTLRTQDAFDWGMTVLPKGSQGRVHITWPDSWSVAATSEHKDLAVELILALCADPNGVQYYTLPFIKTIVDEPAWRQEGTKPENRIDTMFAAAKAAVPGAEMTTYRWTEWFNTWVNELTFAFIGERDVPTSVQVAAESMQAIVDNI
jgi:ABC-type glycerol-3-phosphate transport system substrate-binding protein